MRGLVLSCLLLTSLWLFGQQATVSSFPMDWQLYPRDLVTNEAIIQVTGVITDAGNSAITLEITKDGLPLTNQLINLSGTINQPFNFSYSLPAELHQYGFNLIITRNGINTTIQQAQNVVAGDVFVIQGQSNAYAGIYGGATYTEPGIPWVQSFGTTTLDPNTVLSDSSWYQANAITSHQGRIGIWGMKLGELLSSANQIPVAILNGSKTASSITVHQEVGDTSSLYGQLLYRAQRSKLASHVRAVIWWQGERDALGGQVQNQQEYYNQFLTLRTSWNTDFPLLEKIYLTQIHTVLNEPIAYDIREAQRKLALDFTDIRIQTPYNIGHFDNNSHHEPAGYELFAQRMFQLLMDDLYGMPNLEIDPPQILSATYNGLKTSIDLEFDQPILWQAPISVSGAGVQDLRDYLYLDGVSGLVDSVGIVGNHLFLYLKESVSAERLTYLPASKYINTSVVYRGPWITNTQGIGAVSWHDLPVLEPSFPIELKVFLEGSYNGSTSEMETHLNNLTEVLPGQTNSTVSPIHPYGGPRWNYSGNEGLGFTNEAYNEDVVDWVLVSLRSDIFATSTLYQAAGLLDADGRFRFVDPPFIILNPQDAFYIVIEHRNHIGVMTPSPVNVVNGQLSFDFTTQDSYNTSGTSYGSKEVLPGTWAMIAGDGDQLLDTVSYDINGRDKQLWSNENGFFLGYYDADYNMSGDVTGADRIIWSTNNGFSSRVPR